MGRSTRFNPTQQFKVAPTDGVYTLLSDPDNAGQFYIKPISDAVKPTDVTTETAAITSGEVTGDSKVFNVTGTAGYAPTKAFADLNGKFNVGTVQSIAAGANGSYDITVTGFADESMADDEMGLLIIWQYSPN